MLLSCRKAGCVAFVVLAANYHQLTNIPSVPGDHPQRTLADTKAQLIYIQHREGEATSF